MNRLHLQQLVREALNEDIGYGDWTSEVLIPASHISQARLIAKEEGVVAGLEVAREVFAQWDPQLTFNPVVRDGAPVAPGEVLVQLEGSTRSILTAERVALNLLQRMSGIATVTQRVVRSLAGLPCRVLDTRKTTPGLRMLEKWAVQIGGGTNHRFGLSHGVMIKDNHIVAAGGLREAVECVRQRVGHMVQVEVEADTLEQVREAVELDIDALLLDNMDLSTLREAVQLAQGKAWTEASGGITPENARAVAETGVDAISLGWLTHSAPALDISLDLINKEGSS
ncbi:carboxylating nicotinate-nucleotide diphosphorylase [Desmospora activa]|uniref:Probable nicotinate-nucleotide pyrophosphorylase [carboxylating] n=1 Tax=Desmospora activa DSM 45169 TaxID=1121389 RepID=A0A2T4ZDV1_9BACL|nr:carboxylating nicotinate-nucleotide diphosphorylase [Desmospora activa]PTM60042.1 nicotinate-nucleotide pyrophosphorylase [carboxylating] [Desmospora activa DSM 45169]